MTCARCGHENEPGARFCSSCGSLLDEHDDATVSIPTVDANGEAGPDHAADLAPGTAVVVVERGPNAGSSWVVTGPPVAAGRHPDSEMFLDDITVSRRHALFERSGDGFVVRDVGSLNGTYVNRDRVDERALHDGDEIQIGRFVLRFHESRA